ncbi:MAG: DUF3429 domain-containing protein [Pseudomonadota bacterium]
MTQDVLSDEPSGPPAIPVAAKWLGGLGVIPFVVCAAATLTAPPILAAVAALALLLYGAIILSFLGGIQWGLEIARNGRDGDAGVSFVRLTVSVIPALIGWCSLLLPREYGLVLLAVAFACVLAVDLQAARTGQAPAWYPKLRWPLTVTAIVTLLAGMLG